jgi:hypothetical protein
VVFGGLGVADARVRFEVVRVGGEWRAVGRHLIQVDVEKEVLSQIVAMTVRIKIGYESN